MNLKRLNRHLLALMAIAAALVALWPLSASAQSDKRQKRQHVLILNSFDESSPWVQEYINGLMYYIVNEKGQTCTVRHLNATEINDDTEFNETIESMLDDPGHAKPNGVILVGRQAFSAREEINNRWKNIPMLYLGENQTVYPKEYEYAGADITDAPSVTLPDIRDRYNFAYVMVPAHYRKTIDMMMQMQPNMKKLVLASNTISSSLQVRDSVRAYLRSKYPGVTFEWLYPDSINEEIFGKLLEKRDLETGILLGNWYHSHPDDDGNLIFTAGDVEKIDSTGQPVFTIKENYYKCGVVGGVLPVRAEIMKKSKEAIDAMLKGENMRRIPLDGGDKGGACIDFPQLKKKGLENASIPKNIKYVNKPSSLLEKDPLVFAVILLVAIALMQVGMYYLFFKGKTESFMKRREIKINHLPINYFTGKVKFDANHVPVGVDITPGNKKASSLVEKNKASVGSASIFSENELIKALKKLGKDGYGTKYVQYLPATDQYFEVTIHKGFEENSIELFCFNITQRIKTQKSLQYTSAMLEMTLDLAQIVPWHWNLVTHRFQLKYNDALQRLNSTLESDANNEVVIPERVIFKMIDSADLEKVRQMVNELVTGQRQYVQTEFKIEVNRSGAKEEEWIEVNASVEKYDDAGVPEILIGSFGIITERKDQMQKLIKAREVAKESDRLKSAFLANMSHEIRTPLNAIVGFANLVCKTTDPEKKKRFVEIIEVNNNLLLKLIGDILDISKADSDKLVINRHKIDVNKLITTICAGIDMSLRPHVRLEKKLPLQTCYIISDTYRVTQVINNLITNAVKFTERGSISVGYEVEGDKIRFFVRDTGMGISETDLAKLFTRFTKLNSFVQGTGLGLSISKAIIEKLGGTIKGESAGKNKGATFSFTLPFSPADNNPDTIDDAGSDDEARLEELKKRAGAERRQKQIEAAANEEKNTLPSYKREKKKILVVEDNQSNTELINALIGDRYELVYAADGREAVKVYVKETPDLVLMDLNLPVKDGYEATAEIRTLSQNVPIIAVTAYAQRADRIKVFSSGFDDYLSKPVDEVLLLETIRKFLG